MLKLFPPLYVVAAVLSLSVVPTASAATITTKFSFACITEELLDESIGYLVRKDQEGMLQFVMSGDCMMLQAGETVSVIRKGIMVATIRYKGIKLFISSGAIR